MREAVIQSWCDQCYSDGKEVVGQAIDFVWNGRDVSIDLCGDHVEPFQQVDDLVARFGTFARKKYRRRGSVPAVAGKIAPESDGSYHCPDCERTSHTPQGLSAHRRAAHGYRAATK